jgi:hypothetical protein
MVATKLLVVTSLSHDGGESLFFEVVEVMWHVCSSSPSS